MSDTLGGFELGQVHCADCLDALRQLPDGCVDAVVTDIPYNKVNRESNGLRSFDKGFADSAPVDVPVLVSEIDRLCTGSAYLWCGTEQVSDIRKRLVDAGFSTRLCIWEKANPPVANGEHLWLSGLECCVYGKKPRATFNRHCKSPVWRGSPDRERVHPTQKPAWLMRELIEASSNPGDLVLDPFAGSGTTGVACAQLGRRFLGFEIDQHWCEVANARIAAAVRGLPLAEHRGGQGSLFEEAAP